MAVAVALTLGAASPAAGGLIMATRLTIQQIFKRLVEQLGRQALKQTAQRAIKQLTTREGLSRLGRTALHEGFDEAHEEVATGGSIQLYQMSTGRAQGFDLQDLGLSAAAGFAGGAAATGSHAGSRGHGSLARDAGGEVLAEFGAATVTGDLPDAENLAKAASSGASGSAIHHLPASFTTSLFPPNLPAATPPLADATQPAAVAPLTNTTQPIAAAPLIEAPVPAAPSPAAPSPAAPSPAAPSPAEPSGRQEQFDLAARFNSTVQPDLAPPDLAPPDLAPPDLAPPDLAPPNLAPPNLAPPNLAPPNLASPDLASPDRVQAAAALLADVASPPQAAATDPFSAVADSSGSAALNSETRPTVPTVDPPSAQPVLAAAHPDSVAAQPPSVTAAQTTPHQVGTLLPTEVRTPDPPTSPNPTPPALAVASSSPDQRPSPPLSTGAIGDNRLSTGTHPAIPNPTTLGANPASTSSTLTGQDITSSPGANPPSRTGFGPQALPGRSDLDRIAEALAPRPSTPTSPRRRPPSQNSTATPSPPDPPPFVPPLPDPPRDEYGYFGYAGFARRTYETNRRDDYIAFLATVAQRTRAQIISLNTQADAATRSGFTLRAADDRRGAAELSSTVAEIEVQIDRVRSGDFAPATVDVDAHDWARINADVGNLAPGGVRTDELSALTGDRGRLPIDRTRRYHVPGGLRPPLAVHQGDLENAVPRDGDGRPTRLPDPRVGQWFALANDGGPKADPTRGLNCVDGVLALYDTYMHARPRVSAPRTFDSYANGDPNRPLGGEVGGIYRVREATGGTFQSLCPSLRSSPPAQIRPVMDNALRNLSNHLRSTGHGAFAFIVTDLEAGGCHAWAATNQHGTILFLDPQVSRLTEDISLYRHRGTPSPANITAMDALVVDGVGNPAPLPHHIPGRWNTPATGTSPQPSGGHEGAGGEGRGHEAGQRETPRHPEGSAADGADSTAQDEMLALASLRPHERDAVLAAVQAAEKVAVQVSRDLHHLVGNIRTAGDDQLAVIDEDKRVKSAGSLARKVRMRLLTSSAAPEKVIQGVNDLVRFSVQVPPLRYGHDVSAVLHGLQTVGYRDIRMITFWTDHGRHNGLNVSMVTPTGFRVEVQFPTPLSAEVGHRTHVFYEAVRRENLPIHERVNAFLEILRINRSMGIYQNQPAGLDHLVEFTKGCGPIDTTLVSWLSDARRGYLAAYRRYLDETGQSFADILDEHHLDAGDVPGAQEAGLLP